MKPLGKSWQYNQQPVIAIYLDYFKILRFSSFAIVFRDYFFLFSSFVL